MTTFKIPQPAPCPICGKDDCIDDEHEDRAQAARQATHDPLTLSQEAMKAHGMDDYAARCPNCWAILDAHGNCPPCTHRAAKAARDMLAPEPIRGAILDAAKAHTLGDRNDTHGDPIPAMELFMDLVEPILERRKSLPKAAAGALILDAYKRARILHNPYHRDSYEDGCAYTAIAGEAAHRSRTTP